jgi:hypothetical protein
MAAWATSTSLAPLLSATMVRCRRRRDEAIIFLLYVKIFYFILALVGSAVYIDSDANVRFDDCSFYNNSAMSQSTMHIEQALTVALDSCSFEKNYAAIVRFCLLSVCLSVLATSIVVAGSSIFDRQFRLYMYIEREL